MSLDPLSLDPLLLPLLSLDLDPSSMVPDPDALLLIIRHFLATKVTFESKPIVAGLPLAEERPGAMTRLCGTPNLRKMLIKAGN